MAKIYVNLTQVRVILKGETSIETMPPPDWPVHFLGWALIWESPAHYEQCHPWTGGSGYYNMEANGETHKEQDSKQYPSVASAFVLASRFLSWISTLISFNHGLWYRSIRKINPDFPSWLWSWSLITATNTITETEIDNTSMEYWWDRPDHVLERVVEEFWNLRPEELFSVQSFSCSVVAWKSTDDESQLVKVQREAKTPLGPFKMFWTILYVILVICSWGISCD